MPRSTKSQVKSAKSQMKTAKSEMQKTEFKSMAQSVRAQPIHKDAPPDETLTTSPESILAFKVPFNDTKELTLRNNSTKKLTFKMKSTNLQRFKAAPSNGYIEPNAKVVVHITCKPFEVKEGPQRQDRISVLFVFTLRDGHEITPKAIDKKMANRKTLKIQYLSDSGHEMEMRTVMEPMSKAGGKSQVGSFMIQKSKAPKSAKANAPINKGAPPKKK